MERKSHPLTEKFKARDSQIVDSAGPLPLGSRVIFFVGGKGSSKTTTMLNLLTLKESPYRKYFKNIFLVSPSAAADRKLGELYDELDRDGKTYDTLNETVVEEIIDRLKEEKSSDPKAQNLVIIDDCSHLLPTGRKPTKIAGLFTNSRHLNASVWLVSHKFTAIPPLIRNQMDALFLFKTNSKSELKSLEAGLNVDEDEFRRNLAEATGKPYGFLLLNLTGPKPRMFDKFDEFSPA